MSDLGSGGIDIDKIKARLGSISEHKLLAIGEVSKAAHVLISSDLSLLISYYESSDGLGVNGVMASRLNFDVEYCG